MTKIVRILFVSVIVSSASIFVSGQDKVQLGTSPKCDPVTNRDASIECTIYIAAPFSNRSSVTVTAVAISIKTLDGTEIANDSAGFVTSGNPLRPGEKNQLKVALRLKGAVVSDTHYVYVRVQYRTSTYVDSTGKPYNDVYLTNSDSVSPENWCPLVALLPLILLASASFSRGSGSRVGRG